MPLATGLETATEVSIVVRSEAPLAAIVPVLRKTIRPIAPDAPLHGVEAVAAAAARGRSGQRLTGTIFAAIAIVALLLSTVGLYALTAYAVTQRRLEVGIRIALGARPRAVVWLFVRRTLMHLAIGVTLGVAGAIAAGRLLQSSSSRSDRAIR